MSKLTYHCITKELEARLFASQHTRSHWTRVQANAHLQVGSIISQCFLQVLHNLIHFDQARSSKLDHKYGMILLRVWETSDCDVAVTNGFNLKDVALICNSIECPI